MSIKRIVTYLVLIATAGIVLHYGIPYFVSYYGLDQAGVQAPASMPGLDEVNLSSEGELDGFTVIVSTDKGFKNKIYSGPIDNARYRQLRSTLPKDVNELFYRILDSGKQVVQKGRFKWDGKQFIPEEE